MSYKNITIREPASIFEKQTKLFIIISTTINTNCKNSITAYLCTVSLILYYLFINF